MEKEELEKIITVLEESSPNETAFFSIDADYGEHICSLRANEEGLQLMAAQFLAAARKMSDRDDQSDDQRILLDWDQNWIEGELVIQFVEYAKRDDDDHMNSAPHKASLKEKLMPLGCLAIIVILVISIFVGLSTIYKWLF